MCPKDIARPLGAFLRNAPPCGAYAGACLKHPFIGAAHCCCCHASAEASPCGCRVVMNLRAKRVCPEGVKAREAGLNQRGGAEGPNACLGVARRAKTGLRRGTPSPEIPSNTQWPTGLNLCKFCTSSFFPVFFTRFYHGTESGARRNSRKSARTIIPALAGNTPSACRRWAGR